jgi:hypothetical protein
VVTLERDHKICSKGDKLTSEQARLLKAFGMKLAEVSFFLDCCCLDGTFELVGGMDMGDNEDSFSEGDLDEEEEEEEQQANRRNKKKNKVQAD